MVLKKSLSGRRVPRKIGQNEDEESVANQAETSSSEPVVKRPVLASKVKKRSNLRMSFGPGESNDVEDQDSTSDVSTPRKSNLNRIALENKAKRSSLSNQHLPFRSDLSDQQPSYSREHLEELKQSTPSTPKERELAPDNGSANNEIDIAAKFGPLAVLQSHGSPFIPSEAEIREKKERRRRLAKEEEYMSLEAGEGLDSGEDELTDDEFCPRRTKLAEVAEWKEQHKYGESRLEREDEDIAEGFDNYVEDGGINIGRKAKKEAEKKRREDIASMIASAEAGSTDDGSDESEVERLEMYELAQTRAGAYGSHETLRKEIDGQKTPPRIAPLPTLHDVTQRLQTNLNRLEAEKARRLGRLEELRAERAQIKERESWIQAQLKETGVKYEKLRAEAGLEAGTITPVDTSEQSRLVLGRGLESLGATPITTSSENGLD